MCNTATAIGDNAVPMKQSSSSSSRASSNGTSGEEAAAAASRLHPIQSGIPPWHSVFFLTALSSICIPLLPSVEHLDARSSVETWTHRKFPDLVSLRTLAGIRLVTAFVALGSTFYLACIGDGWPVFANYKPNSKLRREFIRLQGLGTLCPFTSWAWMIFGFGFLTRGAIALAVCLLEEGALSDSLALAVEQNLLRNKILLRTTLVLWELTGPLAILVSAVVKYAIWPQVIKGGKPHKLAGVRNQLQHNANSIMSLMEVTLLSGTPIAFSHLSMATVIGCAYVFLTWVTGKFYFGNAEIGPQYIYWFMDTTVGKNTTIALACLAFATTLSYGVSSFVVFAVLGDPSTETNPSLWTSILFLLIGTRLVCRFRN